MKNSFIAAFYLMLAIGNTPGVIRRMSLSWAELNAYEGAWFVIGWIGAVGCFAWAIYYVTQELKTR